ncbi:MAG: hypothetical protein EXS36_00435 [Pedosphaera sp.]|nr:hypothetical protein [Pedosphaera sp.]
MSARGLNVILAVVAIVLGSVAANFGLRLRHLQSQADAVAFRDATMDPETTAGPVIMESSTLPASKENREESPPALDRASWKRLEADDYPTYIRNLRQTGCPESTIRDIIMGNLNRNFASQRAQLTTPSVPPFWQSVPKLSGGELQAREEQLRALDQKKKEMLRSLLGIDPGIELRKIRDGFGYTDNRLGGLSEEKQDQVSLVREEQNELWRQVQAAPVDPAASPDALSLELQRLDEDRLARLAQILRPAELIEHELQTSWTAIQLRESLAGFQTSAAEFRMLYDLQKPFDDEYVHRFGNRTDGRGSPAPQTVGGAAA